MSLGPTASPAPSLIAAVAWGDVPGWVSAIAAILALAAAVAAALYVRSQYIVMRDQRDVMNSQLDVMKEQAAADRDEIARQRTELTEGDRVRARVQANLIDFIPARTIAELSGLGAGTYLTATVVNNSNRPVRLVRVKANPENGDTPTHNMDEYVGRIRDVGDTGRRFVRDTDLRSPLELLRRGEDVTFLFPIVANDYPRTRFWLQFEDDAGLLWELDSDAHLRPITERWPY